MNKLNHVAFIMDEMGDGERKKITIKFRTLCGGKNS